ncbi:MAG: DNA polymerase III subunit chi [Acidiferrobacterales bacterium]|nr:DNA polymerase III subunit chi [Acidiferrobacterales bacterium]
MSTEVVFYYLKQPAHDGVLRLTCNLANAAFTRNHKVYIAASSPEMCTVLDDLLWTFAPNSYVPHIICDQGEKVDLERYPVVIGHTQPSDQFDDVLISLHQDVSDCASRFQRVVEPVGSNEADIANAEKKFSRYTAVFETEPTCHYL